MKIFPADAAAYAGYNRPFSFEGMSVSDTGYSGFVADALNDTLYLKEPGSNVFWQPTRLTHAIHESGVQGKNA